MPPLLVRIILLRCSHAYDRASEIERLSGKLSRLDSAVTLLMELIEYGMPLQIKLFLLILIFIPEDVFQITITSYEGIIHAIYKLIHDTKTGLHWEAISFLASVAKHGKFQRFLK